MLVVASVLVAVAKPFNSVAVRFLCSDLIALDRQAPPYFDWGSYLARASRARRGFCCPGPTSQLCMRLCIGEDRDRIKSSLALLRSHDCRAFWIVGFLIGSHVGFHSTPAVRAFHQTTEDPHAPSSCREPSVHKVSHGRGFCTSILRTTEKLDVRVEVSLEHTSSSSTRLWGHFHRRQSPVGQGGDRISDHCRPRYWHWYL